jgi:hypothetical protein
MCLGGRPAPYGEANITRVLREMTQARLYSTTCTSQRETPQLFRLTEQVRFEDQDSAV